MTAQSVCAVIVSYHPTSEMIANMPDILDQVQSLVVVDNASSEEALLPLRSASQAHGFHLIENDENLGIAEALNQGVRWAKINGYLWVILFDQDSKITDGFVGQMLGAWESHPERERVASIHPRYLDPKTNTEMTVQRASDGSPVTSLTSGALMPVWIFDRIGLFASEYFIDLVDWEYCLRIRAASYLIAESPQAILLHAPGDQFRISILGHTFHRNSHNATRRYYMTRNTIVFFRQYLFRFPQWVLSFAYKQLKDTVGCFIAEEDRAHKFRSFLLGTWDGLIGRMGSRDGL